jgi:hypothetical protein
MTACLGPRGARTRACRVETHLDACINTTHSTLQILRTKLSAISNQLASRVRNLETEME